MSSKIIWNLFSYRKFIVTEGDILFFFVRKQKVKNGYLIGYLIPFLFEIQKLMENIYFIPQDVNI